jgi:putative ABC transport system permease protein
MIAGSFIMNRQINFVEHRSLGYNRSQVLNISLPEDSVALLQVPSFRNALQGLSVVKGASVQTGLAIDNGGQAKSTTLVKSEGHKRELMSNYFSVDDKFIPMLDMKLLAGRNFSEQITSDKKEGFIVNEAFVRQVGWKKPIGEAIEGFDHKGHVVGVVNDFHYTNMHNPIAPLVMIYSSIKPLSILVKVNPSDLGKVRTEWQKFFPEFPFDYQFMDDAFNAAYRKDVTTIRLFNYFTILSIVLACLGLYGLAYLIVSQRTREIGIRKVLGAAIENLLVLLSKGFLKLVTLAALLAIPITLLVMNKWLNTYAYHIHIQWWLMLIPIALILLISISVIGYQVIRVALTKPVKSLRSE